MEFVSTLEIDASRENVWETFDSVENLKKWQPSLVSFDHVSGEPGEVGAVSRLVYREGDRETILTETITSREYPREFAGTYTSDIVDNSITNRFEQTERGTTLWTLENNFEFSGFMRVLALFMGGTFRRRTEADMQRFKELAEGTS